MRFATEFPFCFIAENPTKLLEINEGILAIFTGVLGFVLGLISAKLVKGLSCFVVADDEIVEERHKLSND